MDVLIVFAMPVFVLSMWIEHRIARRAAIALYDKRDTTASLLMGVGSVLVGVPFKLMFLWLPAEMRAAAFSLNRDAGRASGLSSTS